ncbi:MAG: class I SAM-dependent methyltransferase [Rhodobacteraceae bacterium]|nr:class I SAM-dependent methyltransferase [Paracoccaceae bacterium]
MDSRAIRRSYARWAPIYDQTFGAVTSLGRRRAADYITARGGAVLEVGVGTGLALGRYGKNLAVTGVDFSEAMLAKARERVLAQGLRQVCDLRQMDARALDFPDNHFDTVAAMHVLSVVPEPERVVDEMARVTRPGGEVVIVNHFARDRGVMAAVEKLSARFPDLLGWHADFEKARVLGVPGMEIAQDRAFPPFGMMTFLVLRKAS